MLLRGLVEVGPGRSRFGFRHASLGVDDHSAARRHVDHQRAFADGVPGHVVPAAADRDRQPVGSGDFDTDLHVVRVAAAEDDGRPVVDHPIEDCSRLIIRGILRADDLTPGLPPQLLHIRSTCVLAPALHDSLPFSPLRTGQDYPPLGKL